MATSACAETIVSADYAAPTDRYAHGILGDAIEWGTLEITTDDSGRGGINQSLLLRKNVYEFSLPLDRVFEDVAPRLADVDNDGAPEVIVVETHFPQGAQLAIYDETGKIAATPHIGRTNRWLAPIGVADLDGDGLVEVAYIDRPHLAKTLRVWRFVDGALEPVADLPGLTNHRIGERDIGGGIRDCGQGPEMITANADWSQIMATTLTDGKLQTRAIGAHVDRRSFATALACRVLR
ncbi:VCBS repeat-containing protein [Yoonia sp. F2084L]|nr:VCBS repeat-containing protein [Yoonia sp. F2084L]MCK0096259.1 VCBS repeat-containing protein [Yoonia sp. F2084L]